MHPHITEYRVIYGDSDPFDVVYYANYFNLFERGRTELFRALGLTYRAIADQGIYMPVSETHCAFKQSARYDDLVSIETRIAFLKKARIRFDHAIYRTEPRELLAEGYTVHAFVTSERKVTRPPREVINAVRRLDPDLIAG